MADAVAESPSSAAIKLTDLPVEILHNIKANLHDLQSHVRFSQTCKATNALYTEEDWRRMMFVAGWSAPIPKDRKDNAFWGKWAQAIVDDASKFPRNKKIQSWISAEVIFQGLLDLDTPCDIKTPSEVKRHKLKITAKDEISINCNFSAVPEGMFVFDSVDLDYNDDYDDERPKVLEHPSVGGRLFTSPAVSYGWFEDGKSDCAPETVENPLGLTLADALMAVAKGLSRVPREYWDQEDWSWFEGFWPEGGLRFTVNWSG